MAEDPLKPYLKRLLSTPDYLETFRDAESPLTAPIQIYHFSSPDRAPERFELKPYPFQTLYDLKIMIYQHFRKDPSAHPMFQSLLIPSTVEEDDPARFAVFYKTFDYEYSKLEGEEEIAALQVIQPFERIGGPSVDTEFVSESGRRLLQFSGRSRMTLEDFLKGEAEPVVLHLILFKDVLPLMNEGLRASDREWFGRINPYFPDIPLNFSLSSRIPEDQVKRVQLWDTYVSQSTKQLEKMDELLENRRRGRGLEKPTMVVAGCKFMRLVWQQPKGSPTGLENLFYQLNATHKRPFLRILPVGATPITKLKMEVDSLFKIPEISDPRLLLAWKEERSPNPNEDYMFAKVILRERMGLQPALYGTLRIQHDQSADFVFEPPKSLRLLNPDVDLSDLDKHLSEGFQGTPVAGRIPELAEANLVYSISLSVSTQLITKERLQTRLKLFRTLFQEIPSLPGENPLAMLRYRAVSNYALEDRMYYFLQLQYSRELVKGDAALPSLVVSLQKEFLLSEEEAQQKVLNWIRNRGQIQLADPQRKDFVLTYNPGVDIAIYGQQSLYTIHLYRVDSLATLRRILTSVRLLLVGGEDRDFQEPGTAAVETLADAVVVAAPGVDPVVAARSAPADEPPPGVAGDQVETGEDLPGGDDEWVRLMLGAPGAGPDEADLGNAELFNMGDSMEEARQNAVANAPLAERVANAVRANAATVAAAPLPPPPPPPPPPAREEEEEAVPSGKGKKSYQGWIKSQLQAADQRLFQYKTDVEGRKIKKYVTMCQATESRQPFVMNKEQYDTMKETYKGTNVYFQEYPLRPGVAPPLPDDEVYTVLVYGTNPSRENYYLCCQYFCIENYIMVREKDFKKNNACPFCGGKEIKDLKHPKPGETVIQRRSKKSEEKRHLYVGFLQGETQHPEGFYLPCCFTEDTQLFPSDPRFDYKRVEDEEEKEEVKTVAGVPTTSYQVTLYRAHKKYIVGPEKEFLKISEIDGPQVGLLPPVVDKYFAQDPKQFVSREANKMELLPNANCFLRVAVENRNAYRYDSFFAALAPYMEFRVTAADVKARIREVISPRVFVGLNYGNLVLEFYDAADPDPPEEEVKRWAQKELGKKQEPRNKDALLRIWKSYHRFLERLNSNDLKQYRQYAQMLALPRLLTDRGLVLVVLELNDANELSIRCPPFGYNTEAYASSDVGFILHRSSGIWEPIFYSSNRPASATFRARHLPDITFQRAAEEGWPKIVQQRIAEFESKCRGIGRAPFTSSTGINPLAMLSVSEAMRSFAAAEGVVRDSYNHIVALLYKDRVQGGMVALPVVDDEYDVFKLKIYLDWDDFSPTTVDGIVQYYNANFKDRFALYPGYRIKALIRQRKDDKFVAVQLANGLFIPAKPTEETGLEGYPITHVDRMEWSINKEIAYKQVKTNTEESLLLSNESELHELFQHLRITFSNWLGSDDVPKELRIKLKKIIGDKNLPLYERRKRLEILLGPTIESWMTQEPREDTPEESLLRVDCRVQAQPTCSGRCVWRQSASNAVGRCLLHVPASFSLGSRRVSGHAVAGARLLMLRLIEELLRFPEKRKEIYNKTVSTLVSLKEAKRLGKDQYVLPEGSIAWHDLLRLDWIQSGKETKRYYEEMSQNQPEEPKDEGLAEDDYLGIPLPPVLQELFGPADPKIAGLFLLKSPDEITLDAVLVPLGLTPGDLELDINATEFDYPSLVRLTLAARRPIVSIDTLYDPPQVLALEPARGIKTKDPYILVHHEGDMYLVSSSRRFAQTISASKLPQGLAAIVAGAKEITPQNLNTDAP